MITPRPALPYETSPMIWDLAHSGYGTDVSTLSRGQNMCDPIHQLAADRFDVSMSICFLFSLYMSDHHQELAGDSHNRFLLANPICQALKLCLPTRMMLDRDPGCLYHYSAQIASTFLCDATSPMCFTGIMDAGS
jgi:hypothetical protein